MHTKVWSKSAVSLCHCGISCAILTGHLGYILGEYGHLIANEPGYSPLEQFHLLHSKSQFCVAATRSLLLTTYIKWVNVFPEIKPQLVNIFDRYRHVLDAELQQRACEFLALASRPEDDEFLASVCEEMPPFPPRVSALLGRLGRKIGDTEDKRTWVHGGKEANADHTILGRKPDSGPQTNGENALDSLAGLDLSGSASGALGAGIPAHTAPRPTTGPNIDQWFEKLLYSAEGVLYEDVQIQVGIKSRYQGHMGQVAVYLGNKVSAALTSFTASIHVPEPDAITANFAKIPPSTIDARSQQQQLINVECKKVFTQPPILTVSFMAGSHQSVNLRLPIAITKFFEHVKLGPAEFFERWKLIGGPPREAQSVFPINLDSTGQLDIQKNRKVVSGHRLNVLDDIDPNTNNLVAGGVLHTSVDGKVGCLLRLEPNREAKVRKVLHYDRFSIANPANYTAAMSINLPKHIRRCCQRGLETCTKASCCNQEQLDEAINITTMVQRYQKASAAKTKAVDD